LYLIFGRGVTNEPFKSLTSGESFPYANIEAFYGEISLSVSPMVLPRSLLENMQAAGNNYFCTVETLKG
jgi:hypothetical protein